MTLNRACVPILVVLSSLVACRGDIGGGASSPPGTEDPDEGGSAPPGSEPDPGSVAMPASPVPPSELDALCTKDAPHPRRLLRLSGGELAATARAGLDLADAAIARDAWLALDAAGATSDTLKVTRDFHQALDGLATGIATALASSPGGRLGCAADAFGKDEACTRAFVVRASDKLFRGLANPDDVGAFVALAKGVAAGADGRAALETTVRALLLSPQFLYLTEGIDRRVASDSRPAAPMAAEELASYLAYRLSAAPPSPALIDRLRGAYPPSPETLRDIVKATWPAQTLAQTSHAFLTDWLDLPKISRVTKDTARNPGSDAAFMAALEKEAAGSLDRALASEGSSLRDLLLSDQRSALLDQEDGAAPARPGLFALPGVIAAASSANKTNIPRRGRFLLRTLFCQPLAAPPADLVTQAPPLPEGASQRQRFTQIEALPACGGCHKLIDHLGYAFESWNEVGRFRTKDEHGNVIDTASSHAIPGQQPLVFKDARELMTGAAAHPVVEACFAIQTFRYVARRSERGEADACLLRDLAASGRASGMRVADLTLDALVRSALAPRAN